MADLGTLQRKYQPVLDTLGQFANIGAKLDDVSLAGEQVHIKAQVPSQVVLNRVWDAIKQVDPTYADLKHEIINTGGADQPYTIQSGDNLSKVSQHFYGNAKYYEQIAKANNIADANKIQVGQKISIPVRA
jgi:nucleoid-associated protein YgaU